MADPHPHTPQTTTTTTLPWVWYQCNLCGILVRSKFYIWSHVNKQHDVNMGIEQRPWIEVDIKKNPVVLLERADLSFHHQSEDKDDGVLDIDSDNKREINIENVEIKFEEGSTTLEEEQYWMEGMNVGDEQMRLNLKKVDEDVPSIRIKTPGFDKKKKRVAIKGVRRSKTSVALKTTTASSTVLKCPFCTSRYRWDCHLRYHLKSAHPNFSQTDIGTPTVLFSGDGGSVSLSDPLRSVGNDFESHNPSSNRLMIPTESASLFPTFSTMPLDCYNLDNNQEVEIIRSPVDLSFPHESEDKYDSILEIDSDNRREVDVGKVDIKFEVVVVPTTTELEQYCLEVMDVGDDEQMRPNLKNEDNVPVIQETLKFYRGKKRVAIKDAGLGRSKIKVAPNTVTTSHIITNKLKQATPLSSSVRQCPLCHVRYRWDCHLRYHMKTVHPNFSQTDVATPTPLFSGDGGSVRFSDPLSAAVDNDFEYPNPSSSHLMIPTKSSSVFSTFPRNCYNPDNDQEVEILLSQEISKLEPHMTGFWCPLCLLTVRTRHTIQLLPSVKCFQQHYKVVHNVREKDIPNAEDTKKWFVGPIQQFPSALNQRDHIQPQQVATVHSTPPSEPEERDFRDMVIVQGNIKFEPEDVETF